MGYRTVFISHSAKDAEWAQSLAEALRQRGVSVWFDKFELRGTESWADALEAGLRNSDVVVALLDSDSSKRPNVAFELGAAIGMGKRVVPIVPKDIDPRIIPLDLRVRRYLIRDTPEQTAEELSNALLAA